MTTLKNDYPILIGITGQIESGKSTALKLLAQRVYPENYKIEFLDFDHICKTIHSEHYIEKLKTFNIRHCKLTKPDANTIIETVFLDNELYKQYCEIFEGYLVEYIGHLNKETVYVIEASAIFSYPKILEMFTCILEIIPTDSIRKNNINERGLSNRKVEIIDSRYNRGDYRTIKVNLIKGTLQELRSRTELSFIKALYECRIDPQYFNPIKRLIDTHLPKIIEGHSNNPFHNVEHMISVLTDLVLSGRYTYEYGITALFHDYVYDPRKSDNEVQSSKKCEEVLGNVSREIIKLIKDTAEVQYPSVYSFNFFLSNISHWNKTTEEILEVEKLIFKEYQFVDYSLYRTERLKILKSISRIKLPDGYIKGIDIAIGYLHTFKPKIGMFCGSFHPFTIGHYDVLKKAEKLFDKVIIVQAQHPDKTYPTLGQRLVGLEKYQCLEGVLSIPQLLKSLTYDVTLIRGIRNSVDLLEADNWINQINELVNVEMCLILGNKSLSHISSTFVNGLDRQGFDISKYVIKGNI